MDLKGRHHFTARYNDDMVRDAIKTFVWRRTVVDQKMMWIISGLMVVFAIVLFATGESALMAGVALILGVIPFIFVAVVWRNRWNGTFNRYKSLADPKADMTIDAGGIDIVSELGGAKIAWSDVTEVWERPSAFMIFTEDNEFSTLPSATMPEPVKAYLRARPKQENMHDPILGPAPTPPRA
ncbi:YcxB family protein [Neorhizobium sp. NCHU2750]|uniref:YcxB family protein n=1 Tax=Neorhizobium sp. NCHU2750 TaxID=1825976 RepID=UPI000E761EAF|nr:hypothetical protein NCHU2750_05070 [Neorhizobium sp. NCHU2750]